MRLNSIVKVGSIVLGSFVLLTSTSAKTYAQVGDPGVGCGPGQPCFSAPEPDPGLWFYAVGLLGIGLTAVRKGIRR